MRSVRTGFLLLIVALLFATIPTTAIPSAEIAEDRGAMGFSQALKRLDVVGSVLHTGAHPDDENSALLAWLARGEAVRTAYLSATRGEGGVNLLGTELFEALGVIRTEELNGARRLDHAEQFFTPNYEFGFSKSADDTFTKWPRDQVLGDFVRVIRYFRPEIIISRFTGTPRDGHGHHQVAGIITQEAFKVAADPSRFPEYGKPWQAKKLYQVAAMGNEQNPPPGLAINVGEFDPDLGRSYSQIAAEGRSLHRSQGQGSAQDAGPRQTRLQLVQKTIDVADNAPLFAGVLHKIPDLAQLDPALTQGLADLEQRIAAIRQKVNLLRPFEVLPDLAVALAQLRQIQAKSANEHVRFLLQEKENDFQEALRLAAGFTFDVVASDDTVVPGQEFSLTISLTNGGPYAFGNFRAVTELPKGWTMTPDGSTGSLQPGQRLDQKYKVKVSATADFTQPYWLRQPRRGDRFVWPDVPAESLPVDEVLLLTRAEVDYQGMPIIMKKGAEFKRVDRILGEDRTDLKVVPSLSISVSPEIAVVPLKGARQKEFMVTIENQDPAAVNGEVSLVLPAGWSTTPASRSWSFTQQGEKASLQFTVSVPAAAGDYVVRAVAKASNLEYRNGYTTIAYPHMETRLVYSPAESKVEVLDVAATVSSIGYVEGTGDAIPDALRQLGINVTMLSAKDIATADLSKFPAIVLGVRAYAVRSDLRAYNKRLLDYVSNGGTLIVQYNRANEVGNSPIAPYPITLANVNQNNTERVTHEDAPVRFLDPANPILNVPNRITDKDFDSWIDERGTFFLRSWDPRYVTPLESADPGEPGRAGGLVIGKYGKGTYVYTGYSFFRQLPAGVKGAYRLFANLVSAEN
ncbi:MAG TPA: NEW3 domain-containing protein [Pyrinomonadaceae bacterium]|nr:NEW3 domain-containing protein [Pyrinomonadaceae bacterium]